MVVNRISASMWMTLALAVVVELSACEGESTKHGGGGDDNGGSGGSDGGSLPGGKGGASGFGGTVGGKGGTSAGKGGTTAGGGTAGDAGASQGGQSQGGEAQGGQPTGGGEAGQGTDAGTGGTTEDPTVRGRVVDFWLQPLVNVPVTIGSTTVTTNSQGVFTIPSVANDYDVSLVVSWPGGQAGIYAWRFEGLTRRDPTLQVYKGRQNRSGDFTFNAQGATLGASRTLGLVLAGPNGATFRDDVSSMLMTNANWEGPPTEQTNVHGLLWELDSNELPTVYRSYDTTSVLLDENASTRPVITLNLADETVASGSLSGAVTSSTNDERTNLAFVRFAGGAVIRLVSDYPAANSYNYVVPTLPSSSVTVAAAEGDSFFGAFGVAHRDGLSAGQSSVALSIPNPMTQTMPASGITNVGPTTQFGWTGGAGPCVFHIENVNFYEGMYVVTTRRSIALPAFDGFSLRPANAHSWRVERHGSATSMDAITGPQGFLDSFSMSDDLPYGPRTTDGSFSISTGRGFTTAP